MRFVEAIWQIRRYLITDKSTSSVNFQFGESGAALRFVPDVTCARYCLYGGIFAAVTVTESQAFQAYRFYTVEGGI